MGSDMHDNILSHLKDALQWEGGDEISPALMKAIEDSQIAVILFSQNYASSIRCLSELELILECRKRGTFKAKPVFYKVYPWEVRRQTGRYEQAFHDHEIRGMLPECIKMMRGVLYKAASLSGWRLDANGDEAKLSEALSRTSMSR